MITTIAHWPVTKSGWPLILELLGKSSVFTCGLMRSAVVLEHVLPGSENTITEKQGRVDVDPQHQAGCDEGLLIQQSVSITDGCCG
jgi:hypothetical protein